jgi:hypothetical protein
MKLIKIKRTKKAKPAKKRKPVKKNTWRRKLKAWDLKRDRHLQQHNTAIVTVDDTVRTCINCGEVYKGRVCPQCGQKGTWTRYSWRQAALNFLDIWGLGNRPMFRTLRELFLRPGYMIRDYLSGHRNFYFPPFKLLALMVVFSLFVGWVTGLGTDSEKINDILDTIGGIVEAHHVSPYVLMLANALISAIRYMMGNQLYMWLFVGAFGGLCIWIAFRKCGKYNFVETFVFFIFVLSQVLICKNLWQIGTAVSEGLGRLSMSMMGGGMLSAAIGAVINVLTMFAGMLSGIYFLAVFYLLLLDFKQFYGLRWKSVVSHLLLTYVMGIMLIVWFVLLGVSVYQFNDSAYAGLSILSLILVPAAFVVADRIYIKNEKLIPRSVFWVSSLSMLSVIYVSTICNKFESMHFNLAWAYILESLIIVATTCLSLLPVWLYRRFHNKWIAFIPAVPLLILIYVISRTFFEM